MPRRGLVAPVILIIDFDSTVGFFAPIDEEDDFLLFMEERDEETDGDILEASLSSVTISFRFGLDQLRFRLFVGCWFD